MSIWIQVRQERSFGVSRQLALLLFSLQGRWMKRKVNECGECAGPLWLCVSLISGWWEAIWGRDGTYYCYGTLRTLCEAVLVCLVWGQQYSRYKQGKQHLKGNHYFTKKEKICRCIISRHQAEVVDGRFLLCHADFSFPPTHLHRILLHPPDWIFYSLSALCSFLYVRHRLPSFSISVSSFVPRFFSGTQNKLVGGWRDERSHESVRVERSEWIDSPCLEEEGGKEQ